MTKNLRNAISWWFCVSGSMPWVVGRLVTCPIPKNGQTKVVAFDCSFPNQFELCSKVLPLYMRSLTHHKSQWHTTKVSIYTIFVFTTVCTHVFATRVQLYFNFSLQSRGIHWNPVPFHWTPLDSTGMTGVQQEWGHCKVLWKWGKKRNKRIDMV